MKKLKTHFALFFLSLTILLGLLLSYSFHQINLEEQRLWKNISESSFNQMQAKISDLLLKEDQRSFSQYRYFYVPESQTQGLAVNVSPLSKVPNHHEFGLVGYFQIDDKLGFVTPHLPSKKDQQKLSDLKLRKELELKLKTITQSLQQELPSLKRSLPTVKDQDEAIELSRLYKSKPTPVVNSSPGASSYLTSGGAASQKDTRSSASAKTAKKRKKLKSIRSKGFSRSKIYPNPFKQSKVKKGYGRTDKEESEVAIEDFGSSDDDLSIETVSNVMQYQTFTEQKFIQEEPSLEGLLSPKSDSQNFSILTDPFKAKLIKKKNIVFYRRVWINQQPYIQGFVVNLKAFFNWTLKSGYQNSELPQFTSSILKLNNQNLVDNKPPLNASKILFERHLGYPLSPLQWQVNFQNLPPSQSRHLLYILSLSIGLLITVGTYVVYGSAANQVLLSEKRQDFVAAITHELKTPLTSIRMYSEMLSEGWVKEESKKQEYYHVMNAEGDRLGKLIDNVLHMARLEKRSYNFELKTESPQADFEGFSKELSQISSAHNFEFKTNFPTHWPKITYDKDALKQILFTLTDNAIKFSSNAQTKQIEWNVTTANNQLICSIRDHGPGIPTKELKKIFQQFYRVESELTRQTKGTGIGLSMALMLAQGMNAALKAQNNPEEGLIVSLIFAEK